MRKTKLNTIWADKLLLFQLYHKEMLVNMIILTEEDVLPEKRPLGKLLKSKDVNIHHYVVSLKFKLVLQKNNINN